MMITDLQSGPSCEDICQAVAMVMRAANAVSDWFEREPPEDAPQAVRVGFEKEADRLLNEERHARDYLIAMLFARNLDVPQMLILPSGTAICLNDEDHDGLSIIEPENIVRLYEDL